MEILVIAPAGYCIGKLFSQKISRNYYLKTPNLIFISKSSNKTLIRTILSTDRFLKINSIIYDKKQNEIKKLENQFINDYPNLSLDERIELGNNIIEIKCF